MKVIVFGATGQTGVHVVNQLLEKNHDVTVYVRNPDKVSIKNPKLKVIVNELQNTPAMTEAMKGKDAVITCLGSTSLKESNILNTFAGQIQAAMDSAKIKKIAYMASSGIHNEIKGIPGLIVKLILGKVLKDHANAAARFMKGNYVFTIARPVQLTDGPLTGQYKTSKEGVPGGKPVARADIAHFLIDAVETNKYDNQSVGISG